MTASPLRADTLVVVEVSRAWLYVRGSQTVRIVIAAGMVAVYGPGAEFGHSQFGEEMDATLHHAELEDHLVRDGWMLEQLTTERRFQTDRRGTFRGRDRRRHLRLVRDG